jgi:hypothetical protein
MFSMTAFVFMIVQKMPSIADQCGHINYTTNAGGFNHDIETECEMKPFNISTDSIYAAGICIFAYMSHCNVLAIFAEVRTKSLERMRGGKQITCATRKIYSIKF